MLETWPSALPRVPLLVEQIVIRPALLYAWGELAEQFAHPYVRVLALELAQLPVRGNVMLLVRSCAPQTANPIIIAQIAQTGVRGYVRVVHALVEKFVQIAVQGMVVQQFVLVLVLGIVMLFLAWELAA